MTDSTAQPLLTLNRWMPSVALLLGDEVEEVLGRFAGTFDLAADADESGQARGLLEFLRSGIARELNLPLFIEDVGTYEYALECLANSEVAAHDAEIAGRSNASSISGLAPVVGRPVVGRPVVGRNVRLERFEYDAPAIVSAIQNCDRLEQYEKSTPIRVILVRTAGESRARTMYISEGFAMLLDLCDGQLSCTEIAHRLRARTLAAGEDFEAKVHGAIQTLCSASVLSLRGKNCA